MSDMTGNEQYRNGEWVADKAETQAEGLAANAFATLALAYEQRTANLIAAATATYPNGQGMFSALSDQKQQEIQHRLGVGLP